MTTASKRGYKLSASNILYHGDARDFLHACTLHEQAARDEMSWLNGYQGQEWREDEPATHAKTLQSLEQYIAASQRAAAIYRETVSEAEKRAVERLRAERLTDFADALEAGDYTGLAL